MSTTILHKNENYCESEYNTNMEAKGGKGRSERGSGALGARTAPVRYGVRNGVACPPCQSSRSCYQRERRRAGRAERTKNGNSARANAGSIGPSALDREDRNTQT